MQLYWSNKSDIRLSTLYSRLFLRPIAGNTFLTKRKIDFPFCKYKTIFFLDFLEIKEADFISFTFILWKSMTHQLNKRTCLSSDLGEKISRINSISSKSYKCMYLF